MTNTVTLCILDGWGESAEFEHNAIAQANTPNWDALVAQFGSSRLETGGEAVGLPEGQMGNSEVGHMTIGAGRVLLQDLPRINSAIHTGELAAEPKLKIKGRVHLLGLFSDGGVHAHIDHIKALAKILTENGAEVFVHAIVDGRDVAQKSAKKFLENCDFNIATVSGRYYTMDRDKRWDRVELAYNALLGIGNRELGVSEVLEKAYANGITDEFIIPTIIGDYAGMQDGDSLVVANFRADRARQICDVLVDPKFGLNSGGFERKKTINFARKIGMIEYSDNLNKHMEILFPAYEVKNSLPEIIAAKGLKQLRIAETEKYAHVTFFMSGGRESPFAGEERVMVPSPKVATYDLQPEMSSVKLADLVAGAIRSGEYALIICNFANADMVGHTGNLAAATKAVEAVDAALGKIWAATQDAGAALLITADHGNAEEMQDAEGNPHTQHSLNPVPLVVACKKLGKVNAKNGDLSDLAPTILKMLEIAVPKEMTGKMLF
jgi:2,3-bisphosphoglycerate-independent phosphoglycerate mutase